MQGTIGTMRLQLVLPLPAVPPLYGCLVCASSNVVLRFYSLMQELESLAKENMRILKSIESTKLMHTSRKLEHDFLANVSHIDRLSTFRGPSSSRHRPSAVLESMQIAKSMRDTKWLPGTDGYQRDLAKSMGHSMKLRCAPVPASLLPHVLVHSGLLKVMLTTINLSRSQQA
jgi:hypothetical protein